MSIVRSLRIGILLLLFLFGAGNTFGQEWRDAFQKASSLYNNNELEQAYEAALHAHESFQKEGGGANENHAAILRLLANICFSQEKLQEGLGYAQQEITIREIKKDTLLAGALSNAAQFYRQMGSYERAIEVLAKSLEILLDFYKPEEDEVVAPKLNIAINHYLADQNQRAYTLFTEAFKSLKGKEVPSESLNSYYYFGLLNLEMGRTEEAVYTFRETQRKYIKAGLTQTVDYALLLHGLAEAYHKYTLFFKSEEVYQQAQHLYDSLGLASSDEYFNLLNAHAVNLYALNRSQDAEKIIDELSRHPEGKGAYAQALNNMAAWKQIQGDWEGAEKLYRQALPLYDKSDRSGLLGYAETSENIALLFSEKNDFENALINIRESIAIIDQLFGPSHIRYIHSQNEMALIELSNNQVAEAKRAYQKSLITLTKISSVPQAETISALTGLAQCQQRMSNYSAADSAYQAGLQYYQTGKIIPDLHYTTLLNNYASFQQEQGNWNAARELMRQTTQQIKNIKGKDHVLYATSLEELALMDLQLGSRKEAKGELDSALAYFHTDHRKQTVEYAALLLSLGRYHQSLGDYVQAEPLFKQSLDIYKLKAGEESPVYANALNAMALFYETLGNFQEAEPLLKKALAILEMKGGKLTDDYSTVLQNLATLYQLEEKFNAAEPLLIEALEIDKKVLGPNHPHYGTSLQNLATLYQKKKQFDKATTLMEEVRMLTEKNFGMQHPAYATVVSNLAALYQDKAEYAQAEKFWKESVDLRRKILGEEHPDFARSLYGLAGVYFATGKFAQAKESFGPVIRNYQNQIDHYFSALSEKEKSSFYNRIKPVFEAYQDFCIQYITQTNDADLKEQLYDLQLSTKAILLNASNKVRTAILSSSDAELKELYKHWQESKENLVKYYGYSYEELDRQHINIPDLETSANDLEKKLSERSTSFGQQHSKQKLSWKDVQARLQQDEAAIEIIRVRKKFVPDSIYYAALILLPGEKTPKVFIWPNGRRLEERGFKYYRNAIKYHLKDTLSYPIFWGPLARELGNAKTLFFSCDGVFNKINFNCLQDPKSKTWILEKHTVRLVSNTRELLEKIPANTVTPSASIFGYADFNLTNTPGATRQGTTRYGFEGGEIPMLPATEKEVTLLQDVLRQKQWAVQTFTLKEASENNIKKINNPRILHIATHGFFLSDLNISEELQSDDNDFAQNPLFRSGILLAGAGTKHQAGDEDGTLTAYEAMNLSLDQTDLVSLSACETGLGEVRNGEGVYGLQRSFLVAGARTVMMSLWQVDDTATQELMSSFYKRWMDGEDKFQAFQETQKEMKKKYDLPFYWGAFILIGK